MIHLKGLFKALALTVSLGAATLAHAEPEFEFVLGYTHLPGALSTEAIGAVPGIVEEATEGRVKITTNTTLVGQARILEGMRDGVIDISLPFNGGYAGTNPEFQLALLPGISDGGIERVLAIVNEEEHRAALDQMLAEKYNGVEVMTGAWCPQVLFSKKEITKIDDWRGTRVMAHNPGLSKIVGSLGGRPMQLAINERIPALQRGVIDGVVGDSCGAYGQGIYEVVDHASIWPYGQTPPWHLIWNRDSLNSMPEDLQEKVLTALRTYQNEVVVPRWNETAAALPGMFEEKGVTWHQVSESERQKIIAEELVRPIFDEWYEAMGARAAYRGDPRDLEQAVRAVSVQ